jgi:hypothetical protein
MLQCCSVAGRRREKKKEKICLKGESLVVQNPKYNNSLHTHSTLCINFIDRIWEEGEVLEE